ncbi:MAG: nucleotidyltransferase domain-containing protein [Cytophagales bacterium]|nr:nucleotidyltransferase domain-containing protein [Cytophagales bacterium]
MKFEQIHGNNAHQLLQCISGSKAYGLNTVTSDTDIRGIFVLPITAYFGLHSVEQVANPSNDMVYFELKRYVELLAKNNPTMLELLNMPEDCILFKHPLMEVFKQEIFLSRLCKSTFAGYAISQIQKAKGLNKKIVNPINKEKKSVEDFCHVVDGLGSIPLKKWMANKRYEAKELGLVAIPHFRDMYALFHQSQIPNVQLQGITSGENASDVRLSSIPKGISPLSYLNFNKDGYSMYCKEYKEYWDWVNVRNHARYESTLEHGKNYDAKNMMHTFRLLKMAEEIAVEKKVIVRRKDRDFLLKIRSGHFEYEDLLTMAKDQLVKIEELFSKSDLPENPDLEKIENLLIEVRQKYYSKH